MTYIPHINTTLPFYFISIAFVIFLAVVILVEAVVLYFSKWGRFMIALRDSTIVNLASTLLGYLILQMIPRHLYIPFLFTWFLGLIISIGMESVILWRLSENPFRQALWPSAKANLASYLILISFFILSIA